MKDIISSKFWGCGWAGAGVGWWGGGGGGALNLQVVLVSFPIHQPDAIDRFNNF